MFQSQVVWNSWLWTIVLPEDNLRINVLEFRESFLSMENAGLYSGGRRERGDICSRFFPGGSWSSRSQVGSWKCGSYTCDRLLLEESYIGKTSQPLRIQLILPQYIWWIQALHRWLSTNSEWCNLNNTNHSKQN